MTQRLWESTTLDYFSPEVWYYMIYIVHSVVNVVKRKAADSYLTVSPLLSRAKVPLQGSKEIMRFETPEQLDILRVCFGETVTYGCRNIHPTLRDGVNGCSLTENSKINFVESGNVQSQPYQRSTNASGIDFEFVHQKLRVVVRYGTYVFRPHPTSGKAVNCPSSHLRLLLNGSEEEVTYNHACNGTARPTVPHPTNNNATHAISPIYIGDVFFRDGIKYRVMDVGQHLVTCCVWKPKRDPSARQLKDQNTVVFSTDDGCVLKAIQHYAS